MSIWLYWHRYRVAAERTQSSIVLLTQHVCAKSSAELLLRLHPAETLRDEATVFSGTQPKAEVARHRFQERGSNVLPIRKPPQSANIACWRNRAPWARSAMTNETSLYACLYVREFPAQALLRHRPELHGAACVIMSGEAPSEEVCSLNTKARLSGMKYGMSRVEIETFAKPIVMRRSIAVENITKAALLEIAGNFSPRVEDRSEDTAFVCGIDIMGTRSLFGPPEQLGKSLLMQVRSFGLSANVAVSSNFYTALSLARGFSRRTSVQVVTPGEEAAALSSLPLTVLAVSDAQLETFASWGIYRLGQLAALPEKGLISRMGQEGKRLRQMAAGSLPHLFQAVEPPFRLEDRLELDAPLDVLGSLLFGIAMMLDQLIARVSARVLALASVTVTLELESTRHARADGASRIADE